MLVIIQKHYMVTVYSICKSIETYLQHSGLLWFKNYESITEYISNTCLCNTI